MKELQENDTLEGMSRPVLNSTGQIRGKRYSPAMAQEPFVDDGFEESRAAWQARGAANDCTTRRKLFILAAILVLSVAILNGLWWS